MAGLPTFFLLSFCVDRAKCQFEDVADGGPASTATEVYVAQGGQIPADQKLPAQEDFGFDESALAGIVLPTAYDDTTCGIALNATRQVCDSLIATQATNNSCDCFHFCGGQQAGCYGFGDTPDLFECEIQDVVLGCQVNFTEFNNSVPAVEPCPPAFMCSRDSMQTSDTIRLIPIVAKLGDVHAGMYCP